MVRQASAAASDGGRVRVWRESVQILTYGTGDPDPNPMFLESRVYQGSSGAVYPFAVVDRIDDECRPKTYEAVLLENEYLRIMVLPELGGRVQMALDKTNDYHFVYFNRVIKPALVGLTGPWISGGIEFNWPQHHRPSTFLPVDCDLEERPDGSCTVWCSEIDRIHGTKGMHGLTLRPGRAVLEVQVRLYNRTSLPQTFLWWANPAVHVDEHHQSVFPPDVHAVMDHGKRAVSSFPIATGEYYKVDYSPGTDISRYKNIPVPTSYMAYRSRYDFVGSYDHRRRAGLLHVANHHIAPGKKQWTWGNGDFGRAWDRRLTDDDGPYIELMCGVYTDNQPDFSWLAPGEEKRFTQYFMPYKGVGAVANASPEAAVGFEIDGRRLTVRAYVTRVAQNARVCVLNARRVLADAAFQGSPIDFFECSFDLPAAVNAYELTIEVKDAKDHVLVRCDVRRPFAEPMPRPLKPIGPPSTVESNDLLYLAGVHLEQYRHATREPADYYAEGLRRDKGDLRLNDALGLLLLRRGRFGEAELHFRRAIERATRHNPNPSEGRLYYHLGVALAKQERFDDAFDAFYKSTWNADYQAPAFFELARIACRRGQIDEALRLANDALARNVRYRQATHLKTYLLAERGAAKRVERIAERELSADAFNAGVLFEWSRMAGDWSAFDRRMRGDELNYRQLTQDYCDAGLYDRALEVLNRLSQCTLDESLGPLTWYYRADILHRLGRFEEATRAYQTAVDVSPQFCFPNSLDDIGVLRAAMARCQDDARAPYLLGNLWYDRRQYDLAIDCWEQSSNLDPTFPTVWRNLGLAYFNKRRDPDAAWKAYERAFALDPSDARVLYELDQLAKRLGHPPLERLERLDHYPPLVNRRDDLSLERVTLLNQLGEHDRALAALLARNFHPWEGGEGKAPAQYVLALTQLARRAIEAEQYQQAVDILQRATDWPPSLGEGKLIGTLENNVYYFLGATRLLLGQDGAARAALERAASGHSEPASAIYYNDQPPEMIFYQGLALRALGREPQAVGLFRRLADYGEEHLDDELTIDFFAVSLPDFLAFDDDLVRRNQVHCHYMMALGALGVGNFEQAAEHFNRVNQLDVNHLGALVHRNFQDPLHRRPTTSSYAR